MPEVNHAGHPEIQTGLHTGPRIEVDQSRSFHRRDLTTNQCFDLFTRITQTFHQGPGNLNSETRSETKPRAQRIQNYLGWKTRKFQSSAHLATDWRQFLRQALHSIRPRRMLLLYQQSRQPLHKAVHHSSLVPCRALAQRSMQLVRPWYPSPKSNKDGIPIKGIDAPYTTR